MKKPQLRHILTEAGADLVGFSTCKEYFPEYTSAVTVGVSALKIYRLHRPDTLQALNEFMDFVNLKARQILSEEGHGSWG